MTELLPDHLRIHGRPQLSSQDFADNDCLYRHFTRADLDESDLIDVESIIFPDLSCNWGRFSVPSDVLFLPQAKPDHGCYSIRVKTARYSDIAEPVHDPVVAQNYENYAHTEVRERLLGEPLNSEPPKDRKNKSKTAKKRRFVWRRHVVQNLVIEIETKA